MRIKQVLTRCESGLAATGSVLTVGMQSQWEENCCFAATSPDGLLKRFWKVDYYNLQQPLLPSKEQTVVTNFEQNHSRDDV